MSKKKSTEDGEAKEHKKSWQETIATPEDIRQFLKDHLLLRYNVVTGKTEFRVPEKDEFEAGMRRKLNLGHTWGHAIEWRLPGAYSHGEAVAIGMVQAARYAERFGIAEEEGLAARIGKDLKACGLPTELPCPVSELLPAIAKDKQAQNGQIRLVLPARIGKVVVKKVDPSTL